MTTDGQTQLRRGGREIVIPTAPLILRFRIELQATDLLVWPKIEVPCDRLGSAGGVAGAGL